MACTVFTRLFHGTNLFPRPHRSSTHLYAQEDGVDAKSPIILSSTLERTPSLKRETAIMAPEQPPKTYASIMLNRVPHYLTPAQLEKFLHTLPQLVQVRKSTDAHLHDVYRLVLDFEPGVDVYQLLGIKGSVVLAVDHHNLYPTTVPPQDSADTYRIVSRPVVPPSLPGAFESDSHAGQLVKLNEAEFSPASCHICCESLAGQPISTPCLDCHQPQCYSCVENQFRHALKDFEIFPASCCNVALHPDVAKGILSNEEYDRYRVRFEEWLAKDKTYCPVPTCSAFIPSRLTRTHTGGPLLCPDCATAICTKCKDLAHPGQPCTANHGKDELIAMLKSFGYKQCPRCRSAVGKMYGCNHIACKCGAHWCWDCMRKIEDCNYDPCEDYAEEDAILCAPRDAVEDIESIVNTDDEDEGDQARELPSRSSDPLFEEQVTSEAPSDAVEQKGDEMLLDPITVPEATQSQCSEVTEGISEHTNQSLETCTPVVPAQSIDAAPTEPINLDDPLTEAWEHSHYDFGDEPTDNDHKDVWGCQHGFIDFNHERIPRYWMTPSDSLWWERKPREVACMRCWEPARVAPLSHELDQLSEDERNKWLKSGKVAKQCAQCGVVMCRRCKKEWLNGDAL